MSVYRTIGPTLVLFYSSVSEVTPPLRIMAPSLPRKIVAAVLGFSVATFRIITIVIAWIVINVLLYLPKGWRPTGAIIDDISKLNPSLKTYMVIIRERYLHIVCPLKVGLPAPNINIMTLDGVKKKLLDFQKKGRPLVVNFGSCT